MENKHAFLIIAHKNDDTFRTLLKLLDDSRNDIFIHMDKKTPGYDCGAIERSLVNSRVFHTVRTDVKWGGYSQINAELLLLKNATENGRYPFSWMDCSVPFKSTAAVRFTAPKCRMIRLPAQCSGIVKCFR